MYASVRCAALIRDGYKFTTLSIESFGGICKRLKFIINKSIKKKAEDRRKENKNTSIYINNFWIKWSVFYNKLLCERIYDHIPSEYYII